MKIERRNSKSGKPARSAKVQPAGGDLCLGHGRVCGGQKNFCDLSGKKVFSLLGGSHGGKFSVGPAWQASRRSKFKIRSTELGYPS